MIATALAAPLLSGCGPLSQSNAEGGTGREHAQAEAALARWADAVKAAGGQQGFVPVGDLTGQIGDWDPAVGHKNKLALMAGAIVAATDLPAESGHDAEIRWDDGTTKPIRTISAAQALQDLQAAGQQCADCIPLQVTAARLATASVDPSRGHAIAPAWEFTIRGTRVAVTRIAVAADIGIVVEPPPWNANDPPTGLSIESALGTVDGNDLTVVFTGAPNGSDKPCGEDYSADAVESNTAVVVVVVPHRSGFVGACTLAGASRTASVVLAQPLGDRAVLEVTQGLPVPVVLTP